MACLNDPYFGPGDQTDVSRFAERELTLDLVSGCLNLALATVVVIYLVYQVLRKSKVPRIGWIGLVPLTLVCCAVGLAQVLQFTQGVSTSDC